MVDSDIYLEKSLLANQVFTPSVPIDNRELFAGRRSSLIQITNAVMQKGHHVILFGERGVGKTSLANIVRPVVEPTLRNIGVETDFTTIINCDGKDDFSSICHKFLREITFEQKIREIGFNAQEISKIFSLEQFFPLNQEIKPEDIRLILQKFSKKTVVILDEIDRVIDNKNKNTTILLADLIKTLADHNVDTTLILIGVANSVEEIIQEHSSVHRNLIEVRLPRMSRDELLQIINNGLDFIGMAMDEEAKDYLVFFSQGLPSYTHRLSLHAVQYTLGNEREVITFEDLWNSIHLALRNSETSVASIYRKAVSSSQNNYYAETLLACALANTDDYGFFSVPDLKEPLSLIRGKECETSSFANHIKDFSDKRGKILEKIGEARKYRYRFKNALLKPYVLMCGVDQNLLTKDIIENLILNEK